MAKHTYSEYTKSRIESFIPFARACSVYLELNACGLCDKLQGNEEEKRILTETLGLIDLLLSPRLLGDRKLTDLRVSRYIDHVKTRIESALTRAQISIAEDYPKISLTQ